MWLLLWLRRFCLQLPDVQRIRADTEDFLMMTMMIPKMIPDSVLWGYNGLPNGKVQIAVQGKTEKDYGKLIMKYVIPEDDVEYVAELWNGNSCVARHFLKTSSTIEYPALAPGSYKVSIYRDVNGNRRWDVGDYILKRLSEPIYWFPSSVSIRAYWDDEEQFDITK